MLHADDNVTCTAAIRAQLVSQHVSQHRHLKCGCYDVCDKACKYLFESKHSLCSTAAQKTMSETKRRRAEHRAIMAKRAAAAVDV
jgi:hypothetical protein